MRTIAHLDADAFFAAVEQASDSKLRGKPIAVGGEKRGIIASASYEARRFGIHTPMPTVRARKLCPQLIVLPGDFERYEQFSSWMFGYCYDFTPDVEQTSIDEGYFDLSGARKPPGEIARIIRKAIGQKLKISVSEGIGPNKLISAIASKLRKPAALEEVPRGGEVAFLHPLPNQWLPGIGPRTSLRLNTAGLAKIHHIAGMPLELLSLVLGNQAVVVQQFARGIDDRPLVAAREPQKTFSHQETFAADVTDEEYVEATLRRMADDLFATVRQEGRSVRTLTVRVRYNDMAEDQVSESLIEPTDLETDVFGRLHGMLQRAWKRRVSLRLISLKLSNVYDGRFRSELPLTVSVQRQDARIRLAQTLDDLRQSHGHSVVLRGHDLRLRTGPRELLVVAEDQQVRDRARVQIIVRAKPASYVPLRCHSHYSFLDSTLSPTAIAQLAAEHGLPAVALTDTGNLHGAVEFVLAAQAAGVRPILGVELRVGPHPLLLYVENAQGYTNLCRLLSRKAEGQMPGTAAELRNRMSGSPPSPPWEWRRGLGRGGSFHGISPLLNPLPTRSSRGEEGEPVPNSTAVAARQRAPISLAFLRRHAGLLEGLIAVSSDPALNTFFPGRFYQAASKGEGVVACPAVHYARPEDRRRYDILQSIRTLSLLDHEHPEKRRGGRYHFRTPSEMATTCSQHPEWIDATHEIAERCHFALPFGKPQFPAFSTPEGLSSKSFLRELVYEGVNRRYLGRRILSDSGSEVPLSRVKAQVEEELSIIAEVGYEDYFLITWDFLQDCRRRGIDWITRGSAADSLVCFCLGISSVCPIRFGLYFRRFLNKDRMALNKLPDIDIDFAHDVKDDVVQLIFEKYGREHCAVVGGFSTFQARSAFAEVAKVLGVGEREVRRFTDHFPWSFEGRQNEEGRVQDGEMACTQPADSNSTLCTLHSALAEQLRVRPETANLPLDEEPYRTALETAVFLDGMPRYPKMHPCGLVLSRQPMHELTPTFIAHKGYATTHFDMDAVEAIGLVKMDILAQGGLAAMRDVKAELAKRNIMVDLERFEVREGAGPKSEIRNPKSQSSCSSVSSASLCSAPSNTEAQNAQRFTDYRHLDCFRTSAASPGGGVSQCDFADPAVWRMIAGGGGRAVHHIESPAMISLCRMTNVREIDGLIAIVSVIRPGAANEGKKLSFTRRYQGLEPVTYPHPSLEACLRSTFGLVVYEEHILQLCVAFAGLPPGRADVLRRALNKQKRGVIQEIRGEFFQAALDRGHAPDKTAEVWGLVTGFAGYAFCKAHSTAYGVEAYQSAWLKHYFPAEFMAAVLTNGKGFYNPLVYVLECHRLGLKLLPPSINTPGPEFSVVWGAGNRPCPSSSSSNFTSQQPRTRAEDEGRRTTGAIRVPVTRVKGLTTRISDALLAAREHGPFLSLTDFFHRVKPAGEEMEALIRVGAFDEFGETRTRQFWQAQHLLKICGGSVQPGQGWIIPPPGLERSPGILLCEPTPRERLQWETDLLGFAVSGHPLELFPEVRWDTYCPVNRLGEFVGQTVTTCGLVVEQRTHHQITGEPMKFLSLADWTGIVETELFAPTYRSYGLATVRYPVLEMKARVEPFENGLGFSLRVLCAGKPRGG